MRRISVKIILSITIVVFSALLLSGGLFLLMYNNGLRQSESRDLENIAAEIARYLYLRNSFDFHSDEISAALQDISNYEGVFLNITDKDGNVLRNFRPVIQDMQGMMFRPGMMPRNIFGGPSDAEMMFRRDSSPANRQSGIRLDPSGVRIQFSISGTDRNNRDTLYLSVYRTSRLSDDFLLLAGRAFGIAALGALVISLFAGIVLGRRITQPITLLNLGAGSLANGDLSARVTVPGRDETARLAQSFNAMADNLERHIGELKKERDSLKAFLADASHELRSPLTAIMNGNEILARNLGDRLNISDERLLQVFRQNQTSVERMKQLLDHLLSLSRIQSGIQEGVPEILSLKALFAQAAAQFGPGGAPDLRFPGGDANIRMNEFSVIRLFRNLLENSVNAGAKTVSVFWTDRGEWLDISVIDDGSGMDGETLLRARERFFKGPSSKGTGLGLAICDEILRSEGSRLELISPPALVRGTEDGEAESSAENSGAAESGPGKRKAGSGMVPESGLQVNFSLPNVSD